LFIGRLVPEKGISTLLDAWNLLDGRIPLKIAGTGPLEQQARRQPNVEWLGWRSSGEVIALLKRATCLILPSTWYEGLPMALIQAFATALPSIVSGHGSIAEIVHDGRTGFHFEPGSAEALAGRVQWAFANAHALADTGRAARDEFEQRYTAASNYDRLMDIYRLAVHTSAA
jgi:glycosyltransferase involved in cell wall biosynthesis